MDSGPPPPPRPPSGCPASLPPTREVEPCHRVCPVHVLSQVCAQVPGRTATRRLVDMPGLPGGAPGGAWPGKTLCSPSKSSGACAAQARHAEGGPLPAAGLRGCEWGAHSHSRVCCFLCLGRWEAGPGLSPWTCSVRSHLRCPLRVHLDCIKDRSWWLSSGSTLAWTWALGGGHCVCVTGRGHAPFSFRLRAVPILRGPGLSRSHSIPPPSLGSPLPPAASHAHCTQGQGSHGASSPPACPPARGSPALN